MFAQKKQQLTRSRKHKDLDKHFSYTRRSHKMFLFSDISLNLHFPLTLGKCLGAPFQICQNQYLYI